MATAEQLEELKRSLRSEITSDFEKQLKDQQTQIAKLQKEKEDLQKVVNKKESEVQDYKSKAKGDDAVNARDDSDFVNLALAMGAVINETKCESAMKFMGKMSGASLQDSIKKLQTQAGQAIKKSNLPLDLVCMTDFGTANSLDEKEAKFLTDQVKRASNLNGQNLQLEDKMKILKKVHKHYNCKFSEVALIEQLGELLTDSQCSDLHIYQEQGLGLQDIWENLYRLYRTRYTKEQAKELLEEAVKDTTMETKAKFARINELVKQTSTTPQNVSQESVDKAKQYLKLVLGKAKVAILMSTVELSQDDPWAKLNDMITDGWYDSIESARLELQSQTKGDVKGQVNALTSTGNSTLESLQKDIQRLKTSFGQVQKSLGRTQQLATNRQPGKATHAHGLSPHQPSHLQSGYHDRGQRKRTFTPRLSDEDYQLLRGKCRLCGNANGVQHNWPNCPLYNGPPVDRLCFCRTGAHPPEQCLNKDSWTQNTQRTQAITSQQLLALGYSGNSHYGPPPGGAFTGQATTGQATGNTQK